jgi:hypothetical protein
MATNEAYIKESGAASKISIPESISPAITHIGESLSKAFIPSGASLHNSLLFKQAKNIVYIVYTKNMCDTTYKP